jgi:hypothetical protein
MKNDPGVRWTVANVPISTEIARMFQPGYDPKPVTEGMIAQFLMDTDSSSKPPVLAFCMWCGDEFKAEYIDLHEQMCGGED